ncbi:DUF3097 family protein [Egicoccus sp. AB-alg6-2]|uniref:DUF3097 family protein n=1 Tax=Egicoccus sp. AB-alg6-2 TaxID=3242692 RepID=UPI00359E016D
MRDPYGDDVLADPRAHRRVVPTVTVTRGLVVEADGGFVGSVVGCTAREVVLRDRRGRERRFALEPGLFRVDDTQVKLVAPSRPAAPPTAAPVSNSGSVAVPDAPARVARSSRILVEGVHDAELVEQVWGHDLRVEGVVVEVLHGADDLDAVVRAFAPGPQRRLGVLLDHLVGGTKESRIATTVRHPHVLVTGHPFVDVWQAVRPEVIGIDAWPEVPHGEPWKEGVARRLGFPDHHEVWRRIRTSVTTWRDLDRSLIRAVEELIDFVTEPPTS